jgi:putative ABC transport system ATP-binding protein
MGLLNDVARESGAALITITHDANIAALARRHYRLDRGVLEPIDAGRVRAAAANAAAW